MIGQYLSNTNERATVSILQNILELNKAQDANTFHMWFAQESMETYFLHIHKRSRFGQSLSQTLGI